MDERSTGKCRRLTRIVYEEEQVPRVTRVPAPRLRYEIGNNVNMRAIARLLDLRKRVQCQRELFRSD